MTGSVVNANFVVQVRTGRASAETHIANCVAAMHVLSRGDGKTGKVPYRVENAVAMILMMALPYPPP